MQLAIGRSYGENRDMGFVVRSKRALRRLIKDVAMSVILSSPALTAATASQALSSYGSIVTYGLQGPPSDGR